jgi:hypothetical protein
VKDTDRMKNKPSFWTYAVAAFAIIIMVAYMIFALTLADHMQSDSAPVDTGETTSSPFSST